MARIVVIEDDRRTLQAICRGLQSEGYEIESASEGLSGMALLDARHFDAVILDWMLPGRSGVAILKGLRARGCRIPVLFLTARDAVDDRVHGLESGADDYLVKPFAPRGRWLFARNPLSLVSGRPWAPCWRMRSGCRTSWSRS